MDPVLAPAARRGVIGLVELAGLDVIHGPRRASPGTYDAWLQALRAVHPRFDFTDPPVRHSLPIVLAFAATARRPAAVLTGPAVIAGPPPGVIRLPRPAHTGDMIRVCITGHPLTATAALVWNSDLPRPLQQILFDIAAGVTPATGVLAACGGPAGAPPCRRTGQRTGSRPCGLPELARPSGIPPLSQADHSYWAQAQAEPWHHRRACRTDRRLAARRMGNLRAPRPASIGPAGSE